MRSAIMWRLPRSFDVPPKVVEGLLNAESKGRYMRAHIIDEYPWEKLR